MTEKFVDLHIHTNYSDGSYSPAEVVRMAHKIKLAAIAITDHDMTGGIKEAVDEGKKTGIEIIPGIEISCETSDSADGEVHILGYYGNFDDNDFQEELELFRKLRVERASKIIKKLAGLKVLLDEKEIMKNAGHAAIGRMHIARLIVSEGFAGSIRECFDKYLAYGKPAYFPKKKLKPEKAVKMMLDIGAIPVLAHPFYGADDIKIVKELVGYGLKGIEVYANRHNSMHVKKYLQWANDLDLIVTGGSDFHYSVDNGTGVMGTNKVPYEVVTRLKEVNKT